MKTEYRFKRLRYLNEISGRYKSKKYLSWFNKKYQRFTPLYILDEKIDYLIYPADFSILCKAKKEKGKYFCKYLEISIIILQEYLYQMYKKKFRITNFEPKELNKLFNYVMEAEK